MGETLRQAGAIPFRITHGVLEVLLITSRDTGRWVIPKGFLEKGKSARDMAAQEAYEEAGVIGKVTCKQPLGIVTYMKTQPDGSALPASIEVFPLLVKKTVKAWPEKGQRNIAWMTPEAAAQLVAEPELATILEIFARSQTQQKEKCGM